MRTARFHLGLTSIHHTGYRRHIPLRPRPRNFLPLGPRVHRPDSNLALARHLLPISWAVLPACCEPTVFALGVRADAGAERDAHTTKVLQHEDPLVRNTVFAMLPLPQHYEPLETLP